MRAWAVPLLCAVGCGGNSSGPPRDLGTDQSAVVDMAPATPVARITVAAALVGFPTSLDGSGSTGVDALPLAYRWRFTQVPPGSTVTDDALSSKTEPKPSFEPDLGGDYGVQLEIADGELEHSTTLVFNVPTAPIFYSSLTLTLGSQVSVVGGVLQSDGTRAHPVTCPYSLSLDASQGASALFAMIMTASGWVLRAYEPATGSATAIMPDFRSYLIDPNVGPDGWPVANLHLFYVEPATSCDGVPQPVSLDEEAKIKQVGIASYGTLFPRFSPDGSRVAYLVGGNTETDAGNGKGILLVTTGIDGHDTRIVHRFGDLDASSMTPPAWLTDERLAIVDGKKILEFLDIDAVAPADADTPTDQSPLVTIDCAASALTIFQIEHSGTAFFVDGREGETVNIFTIDAPLTSMGVLPCNLQPLILMAPGHRSVDFVLSPDRASILFASTLGAELPDAGGSMKDEHLDIFVAPTDGSAAPKRLAGAPSAIDFAPRWVSGGRQFVWTRFVLNADAGIAGEVAGEELWIANADGTHQRSLIKPSGGQTETTMAGSGSSNSLWLLLVCSLQEGRGVAGGTGVVVILGGVLLLLWLRRKGAT